MQNVTIFANPIAGRGEGRSIADLLAKRLISEGLSARIILDSPENADPAEFIAADAILAIGGDGTLRSVAQRCVAARGNIPPLLPIPMGTANLMGKFLGIAWPASQRIDCAARSILRGTVRFLDAGTINGQIFLLMVGVGIDGLIVHEMDRIRKGPINYASYLLPAATAIASYRYEPLVVTVDGAIISSDKPAMAFIANASEYGTGFPLVPDAIPDDGLLDVCVVPVASPIDAVARFLEAAAGEHVHAEGVAYVRGKSISVESPRPVPTQVDGDAAGHTPVHIDLLPYQVPFIVPV